MAIVWKLDMELLVIILNVFSALCFYLYAS